MKLVRVLMPLLGVWLLVSADRPKEDVRVFKIGLFWRQEPASVILAPGRGEYEVIADGTPLQDFDQNAVLMVSAEQGQVHVKTLGTSVGHFSSLELKRKAWGNYLRVKATSPSMQERTYQDNLRIRAVGTKLKMVNHVFIEHYIGGVVEAESGSKETPEFYKVQSVICRTYALNKIRRHHKEGFHLCDQVHCQVYRGKSRTNPDIPKSVQATKGIVLVDSDINLITAAFSSNCGGQTSNSEDVWTHALPYLRSRIDTFCREMPHAHWEREMARSSWLGYLQRRFNYPIADSLRMYAAVDYCPGFRHAHFPEHPSIRLKTIRNDWKFLSAYFSIDEVEDRVVFQGRGYGHGVGLCQEGAMSMANRGYNYKDILHFYYKDVHLVDLSVIDFFREE